MTFIKKMPRKFGTRSEVWEDSCSMTRGGLTKDDLMLSKTGRIVSKKKSEAARAAYNKFGFNKRQEQPEEPNQKSQKSAERKNREGVINHGVLLLERQADLRSDSRPSRRTCADGDGCKHKSYNR